MPRPQPCPACSSEQTTTIESRKIRAGARRRRHGCHACGHRWTVYTDPQGEPLSEPPARPIPQPTGKPRQRKLTPADVRRILTRTDISNVALGRELGVSREAIRHVRIGLAYADAHPELPRQRPKPKRLAEPPADAPSCLCCVLWRDGECGYGFPDPEEEGPGFAADCDHYAPVSQSISRACPSSDQ